MRIEEVVNECLGCKLPFCEKGCPLHNDIRDFIKALKENDINLAKAILYNKNPFPYICSRVCAHEKQCRGNCVKNRLGKAVDVPMIEKYLSEETYEMSKAETNGLKIAIIGSGIGSLALAKLLSLNGCAVDIYERENYIGGTILSGIPAYRLERKYITRAIDEVKALGVNFFLNTDILKNEGIKALFAKGYDKVVLAIGAMKSNHMGIKNEEYTCDGLKLLHDFNILNQGDKYRNYQRAIVVGGGNVAMDCARSLKRVMGDVSIIYRRSIKEMPANAVEIKEAIAEGVKIIELANPKEVVYEGKVVGVKAIKMELGEVDDSGRASFKEIPNSEEIIPCDLLVMAIGQKIENELADVVEYNERGRIAINDKHMTSYPNVYAIGDCVLGPSSVAHTINDAKECFKCIMEKED